MLNFFRKDPSSSNMESVLITKIKEVLSPYLMVDGPNSKLEQVNFLNIRGTSLKGSVTLESTLSLISGCECTDIFIGNVDVSVHPLSFFSWKTNQSQEESAVSIVVRGVRCTLKGKNEEWNSTKGETETLDTRLGIIAGIRQAIWDSLILEENQHDTLPSSSVKWLIAKIAGNVHVEIHDVQIQLFPEVGKTSSVADAAAPMSLMVRNIKLTGSNDDPCANEGFGHVIGSRVVRKCLTVEDLKIQLNTVNILTIDITEVCFAMNMNTEATGLCTAVEIRSSVFNCNLTKDAWKRFMDISSTLQKGMEWETEQNDRLQGKLQKEIPEEGIAEMYSIYYSLLQSPSPGNCKELERVGKNELGLAHDISWLETRELFLGEKKLESLLRDVAGKIRMERKRSPDPSSSSSFWKKPAAPSKRSLAESLSLYQEDQVRTKLIFDALDLDQSGALDVVELQNGLEKLGLNVGINQIYNLMNDMDMDHNGTINFQEFEEFFKRIQKKLRNTEPVSVAILLSVQHTKILIDSKLEVDVLKLLFGASSSGMPYFRRHDMTVGTKKVKAKVQSISLNCEGNEIIGIGITNKDDVLQNEILSDTSIRLLELKLPNSRPKTPEMKEEEEQQAFRVFFEKFVSNSTKLEGKDHAIFGKASTFHLPRYGDVELEVKQGPAQSYIGRIFSAADEITFGRAKFNVEGPTSTALEFSKTGTRIQTAEVWVPVMNESVGHVADLLVRVRTESWFKNDNKMVKAFDRVHAISTAFIYSTGVNLTEFGIDVKIDKINASITRQILTVFDVLGMFTNNESLSPSSSQQLSPPPLQQQKQEQVSPSLQQQQIQEQLSPSLQQQQMPSPQQQVSPPQQQQESSTPQPPSIKDHPADLFGWTTISAPRNVIRSTIRFHSEGIAAFIEGKPIKTEEEEKSEEIPGVHVVLKPVSFEIKTNSGCPDALAQMVGFDDSEEPLGTEYNDDDAHSIGADSYSSCVDNTEEERTEKMMEGFDFSLVFHEEICLDLLDRDKKLVAFFKIIDPRMFFTLRLHPATVDFEIKVQEILLVDAQSCRILSRFLYEKNELYSMNEQILFKLKYDETQTTLTCKLDGFSLILTPGLKIFKDYLQLQPLSRPSTPPNILQTSGSSSSSNSPPPPTTSSQPIKAIADADPDPISTIVLPTKKFVGDFSMDHIQIHLSDVASPSFKESAGSVKLFSFITKVTGSMEITSSIAYECSPLKESISFQIVSEFLKQDLKKKRENHLIDPFLIEINFQTARVGEQQPSSFLVVENKNNNSSSSSGRSVNFSTEISQKARLTIPGGLTSKLDTDDYRGCVSAVSLILSFLPGNDGEPATTTNTSVTTPSSTSSSPPPPQSGAIDDSQQKNQQLVWPIMSALYPTLLITCKNSLEKSSATTTESQSKIVEFRKDLLKKGKELFHCLTPPAQSFELSILHLMLGVGVLGEQRFPSPFLIVHIEEIQLLLQSESGFWFADEFTGDGVLGISCDTFNTISHAWEPLLEPWRARLRLKRSANKEVMGIIYSGFRLNVNLTESTIMNLNNFSMFIDENYQTPKQDNRFRGKYCPNWLNNETGESVRVWQIRDIREKLEIKNRDELVELEDQHVIPFDIKDRRALWEAGNRLGNRYVARMEKRAQRERRPKPELKRADVLNEIFSKIDLDGSGELSILELQQALISQDEVIPRDILIYNLGLANTQENAITISRQDFIRFFSSTEEGSGINHNLVRCFGIRFPNVKNFESDIIFAPLHSPGKHLLKTRIPSMPLVASVVKMGRLSISDVLKLETRIKIENRLSINLQMGYMARKVRKSKSKSTGSFLTSLLSNKNLNEEQGEGVGTVFHSLFELAPGEDRSVPLDLLCQDEETQLCFGLPSHEMEDAVSPYLLSLSVNSPVPVDDRMTMITFHSRQEDIYNNNQILRSDRVLFGKHVETLCTERKQALTLFDCKSVLVLRAVKAKLQYATDINGFSDPYVIIQAATEKFRTPTVKNTLDPHWPEKYSTFRIGESLEELPANIEISIYDEDKLRKDDLIGRMTLDVNQLLLDILEKDGEGALLTRTYTIGKSTTIDLSFNFEKASEIVMNGRVQQRIISFSPPLIIQNFLPFELEISLVHRGLGKTYSFILASGKQVTPPLYFDGAKIGDPSLYDVKVRRIEAKWSTINGIGKIISLDSEDETSAVIKTEIIRDEVSGTRHLLFFADFWIANKVGAYVNFNFELQGTKVDGVDGLFRTNNVGIGETCCICVKRDANDRRNVIIRCNMRTSEARDPVELLSREQGSAFSFKTSYSIDLEDATLNGGTGEINFQSELPVTAPTHRSEDIVSGSLLFMLFPEKKHKEIEYIRVKSAAATLEAQVLDSIHYVFRGFDTFTFLDTAGKSWDDWEVEIKIKDNDLIKKWNIKLSSLIFSNQAELWGWLDTENLSKVNKQKSITNEHAVWFKFGCTRFERPPKYHISEFQKIISERFAGALSPVPGKFFRTRLLTLAPMFTCTVEKDFHLKILVKPFDAPNEEAMLVLDAPTALKMVRLVSGNRAYVQFRLASSPNSVWTNAVPILPPRDLRVQLRDENGNRAGIFFLDMNQSGPSTCLVLRRCPDEITGIAIRNSLDYPIYFRQVEHKKHNLHFKDLIKQCQCATTSGKKENREKYKQYAVYPLDELNAESSTSLAFDIFEGTNEKVPILIEIFTSSKQYSNGMICKLEEGFSIKNRSGVLMGRVQYFGSHLTLEISEVSEMLKNNNKRLVSQVIETETPGMSFAMNISSIGVSIFSSYRKSEVAYLVLQRIRAQGSTIVSSQQNVKTNVKSEWTVTKFKCSVSTIQVDSSLKKARYPVALTSERPERKRLFIKTDKLPHLHLPKINGNKEEEEERKEKEEELELVSNEMKQWAPHILGEKSPDHSQIFELSTHYSSPSINPNAKIFKLLSIYFGKVEVYFDGVFIGALLSVLLSPADPIHSQNFDNEKDEELKQMSPVTGQLLNESFKEALPVPPYDPSFIESSHISSFVISVTVHLGSPEELVNLVKRYGISLTYLLIGVRLSRLEGFKFDCNSFQQDSIGFDKLVPRFTTLLGQEFRRQLAEVVLNFAKRIGMQIGVFEHVQTKTMEKIRQPPHAPSEVLEKYGPGHLPYPEELLIEMKAVRNIERWWYKKKKDPFETSSSTNGRGKKSPPQSKFAKFLDSMSASTTATARKKQDGEKKH